MAKVIDLTGLKFGRLTVVKKSAIKGNGGQVKWECDCDCGNKHTVTGESLRHKKSRSCGCLSLERKGNQYGVYKDRERALLKVQYSHLKRRNIKMGFDNVIDFDIFSKLSKESCYYCGLEYSKEIEDRLNESKKQKRLSDHILKCNGIDRVDSSKGYTVENVVSCCKFCNTAKNSMPKDVFLKWLKKAYEYNIAQSRIES